MSDLLIAVWSLRYIAATLATICLLAYYVERKTHPMSKYNGLTLMVDRPARWVLQRATDDVLLRVTFRDGKSSDSYAALGMANYMLARYTRERFDADPTVHAYVERAEVDQ